MGKHLDGRLPCPVCGRRPEVGDCQPWPRGLGRAPWYVVCHSEARPSHCVAVNGDTRREAVREWNMTAEAMAP